MHIDLHLSQSNGAVPAQVYVVEPLDEFNIITITVNGKRLLVESDPAVLPDIDQTVWLTFPEDKMHLFHPESGNSLRR